MYQVDCSGSCTLGPLPLLQNNKNTKIIAYHLCCAFPPHYGFKLFDWHSRLSTLHVAAYPTFHFNSNITAELYFYCFVCFLLLSLGKGLIVFPPTPQIFFFY